MFHEPRLILGEASKVLSTLDLESIDCVVTSPPYFGLRDYGTDPVVWDIADLNKTFCTHEWVVTPYYRSGGADKAGDRKYGGGEDNKARIKNTRWREDIRCVKCGVVKAELGRERYLQDYVDNLVYVFSLIKELLKPSGTAFLNIGDGYNCERSRANAPDVWTDYKSLQLVPFKLALALQQDGWIVRSEIIWEKRNPAYDSAKDRPLKTHESILVLTKEPIYNWNEKAQKYYGGSSVWQIPVARGKGGHAAPMPFELAKRCVSLGCPDGGTVLDPFMGSGTTIQAAKYMGLFGIGVELLPEYYKLAVANVSDQELKQEEEHNQIVLGGVNV